jgi:hypothetical protein
VHENDFNRCRIQPDRVRADERIAIEMQPGDALVFHSLLHHFTAPNASDLRRRAVQFHYHQTGAVWGSVAEHAWQFRFEDGSYAGCTVPHEGLPRAIVPVETSDRAHAMRAPEDRVTDAAPYSPSQAWVVEGG